MIAENYVRLNVLYPDIQQIAEIANCRFLSLTIIFEEERNRFSFCLRFHSRDFPLDVKKCRPYILGIQSVTHSVVIFQTTFLRFTIVRLYYTVIWATHVQSNLNQRNAIRGTINACLLVLFSSLELGGCPLRGKSSMCMMCLKYRIILLIVIKNVDIMYSRMFCSGAPPRTPLWCLQRPGLLTTFSGSHIENLTRSASTVSPSSD